METPQSMIELEDDLKRLKRTKKACDYCVKRKIKCSGTFPCSHCTRLHKDCKYSLPMVRKPPVKKHSITESEASSEISSAVPAKTALSHYTQQAFLDFSFEDMDGISTPFVDFYFNLVHPRIPALNRTWVLEHLDDIPLYLLWGMYSISAFAANGTGFKLMHNIDDIHQQCLNLFQDAILNPNPFSILFVMLIAHSEFWQTNLNSTASYLAIAVRQCHLLGIHKDNSVTWISPAGTLLGKDEFTGKNLTRTIYMTAYTQDYYNSTVLKIPCMIQDEFLPQMSEVSGGMVDMHLIFRIDLMPLVILSKAIKLAKEQKPNCEETRTYLEQKLINWYENMPLSMPYEEYCSSIAGTAAIAYMNIIYHGQRLFLHSGRFTKAYRTGSLTEDLIQTAVEHVKGVQTIIEAVILKNTATVFMPFFYLQAISICALYKSLLDLHASKPVDIQLEATAISNIAAILPVLKVHSSLINIVSANPPVALSLLESHHTNDRFRA